MIRALIAVGITIAAFVLGTIGFIYTGFYNVGADTPPSSAKEWFLETTMERSVAMRAGNVKVPDLDGEERKVRQVTAASNTATRPTTTDAFERSRRFERHPSSPPTTYDRPNHGRMRRMWGRSDPARGS